MTPRIEKIFLYLFVFVTGAVIIALELTASRILAPFFGNSIFVWGNIIGVTLSALAVGYWIGGRLADRRPEFDVLLAIVFFAGVYIASVPLFFRAIVDGILLVMGGFTLMLVLGSLLAAVILFGLPLALLGMSSPFIIRLMARDVATTGNTAGSVYAFSTVGSIAGAFLSTFVSIPFLGSRETLYLSSFLLLGVASLGLRHKRKWLVAFALLPILLWILTADQPVRAREGLLFEAESPYQFIQVVRADNGDLQLRTNDGWGVQSVYRPATSITGRYYDYFGLLPYYLKTQSAVRVLNVGHAGGSISRIYTQTVAADYALNVDAVEIDPKVTEAAKKYFNLSSQPITIYNEDGRNFLRRNTSKYDIIIVDAYSQQIYIPFQLATAEFFDLARSRLNSQGVVSINVNASSGSSLLLLSISRTLNEVFPYVYSLHVPQSMNYFIVASGSPIDFAHTQKPVSNPYLSELSQTLARGMMKFTAKGGEILTDNRAPVELMTDMTLFNVQL